MNILVAVDLSPGSDKVVATAGRLARLMDAKVYVVHVAEPEPDFVGYDAGPEVVRTQVAEELHREHRDVQKLAQGLRDEEIDATALLIRGPTVETALKEANNLEAGLIVVGSHGHARRTCRRRRCPAPWGHPRSLLRHTGCRGPSACSGIQDPA